MAKIGFHFIFYTIFLAIPVFGNTDLFQKTRETLISAMPFKVDFIQQLFIDDNKETEESGIILINNLKQLKWQYLKPEKKVFLLNDKRYEFYQEEEKQLTRGMIENNSDKILWQLLLSEKTMQDCLVSCKGKRIFILNKSIDKYLNLEVLVNRHGLLEKVIQTDSNGIRNIYLFSNYKTGCIFSDSDFKMVVPQDTEINEE